MKFHVWCKGDWSVGIPGDGVVIDWPTLSENPNDKEGTEYISFVKDNLRQCFADIFDDKDTYVMTDKEYDEFTKEDIDVDFSDQDVTGYEVWERDDFGLWGSSGMILFSKNKEEAEKVVAESPEDRYILPVRNKE